MATVLPGGGIIEMSTEGLPFTATNKGTHPITVQPTYRVLIFTPGVAPVLLEQIWAALNEQGFNVEPYTGPERLLPGLPAVVYVSEPEYEQSAVAQIIREILSNFGVQNVILLDSLASDRELTPGNFIVLPAGSAVALRTLNCIQVYHEPKRTVMAVMNGTGWVEYGPENTKVIVSDSFIVNPPDPGIVYFIAAFEGTLVARFHRMMLVAGPINGSYVFTSVGAPLLNRDSQGLDR